MLWLWNISKVKEKMSNKCYKQFTINTLEDGCLVLKSLIIPVIIDLDKFRRYSMEAEDLLNNYKPDDVIPADVYDSIHDKVLYQQRELLRFIADHQSSSFSYIDIRPLLVKRGYLKRELNEDSKRILNELLDIRNWSFHNAQSMLTADLEIAKKSIPPELVNVAETKPMLNPVIIRKVKSYAWKMLADFIVHNGERTDQFETILVEMKKDYQEMYESLPDAQFMMTSVGLTREIQYLEQEIYNQDPQKAGENIANLSMGIQKGKYDGTNESFKKLTQ